MQSKLGLDFKKVGQAKSLVHDSSRRAYLVQAHGY